VSPRAPRSGDHETFDELAIGWALHALEPEDEAAFARHLPDCARCERTVAETSEVMAAMAADLPLAEPSEQLRSRLRDAVERTEQQPLPMLPPDQLEDVPDLAVRPPATTEVRSGPAPNVAAPGFFGPRRGTVRGWRSRAPHALVAAGAAVIVALGVWNVSLSTSKEEAEATAARAQHVVNTLMATPGRATMAPVTDRAGHRVATVVARQGQVQVVTSGLSVNDRARSTYVIWGTRPDAPVALGTFDVVDSAIDVRTVGSDRTGLDGYSGYAISLEPGRRAPSKPTDIVANGQVTS
jgi:anti-sigma-K factor RskA